MVRMVGFWTDLTVQAVFWLAGQDRREVTSAGSQQEVVQHGSRKAEGASPWREGEQAGGDLGMRTD